VGSGQATPQSAAKRTDVEREIALRAAAARAEKLNGLERAPALLPPGTVRYTARYEDHEFDVVWCG
jgi:hypothetical protein